METFDLLKSLDHAFLCVMVLHLFLAIIAAARLGKVSTFVLTLVFGIFGLIASLLSCILAKLEGEDKEKSEDKKDVTTRY